ncbi:PREDICTED: uncharacterized protein LOC109335768 [Lupinus angustifolius]|uniref:uncharacterized protein LOC109335768 n=1 Tax=Lupinus angustifolius TaxID=3871 RepID=UPI00092E9BCD|nr:PREDICTED: uncharacterized protein LOC109335768 [Lupinus angustifolius]
MRTTSSTLTLCTLFYVRYKLDIKVVHKHDNGRFVFWDRQCADIIGVSTCELKSQMLAESEDNPKAFSLTLDILLVWIMTLRVKVQPLYHQSSVIRISEDQDLIKFVLDQIPVNGVVHLNHLLL